MTQTIKLKRSATQGSAPSTSDLALGEVAINTYDGKMYIKKDDGTASIVEISGGGSGSAYTRYTYTATSSQTTFSVTYEVGFVDVWLNGVKLHSSDFTATNGSTVVLSSGATAGDLFEAIAWNAANVQQNAYGRSSYTATNGQTTFAATYTVGLVNVYMNGVLLLDGTEYTATNGTSIVLASGAATGDSIVIEAFNTFSVSTALAKANNLSDLASASTAITNLGITATAAELNILDGVTATATELNILDGVTATTAELNYVDGVTSNIQTQLDAINPNPTITATASGTLANGDTVCINSDGTVSAVTGSSATEGAGSLSVFNSASTYYTDCVYDKANDKMVIGYRDSGNSEYITAVVGTVSGSTISFGTEATVSGESTGHFSITYDENAEKVLFIYEQSAGLTGRVGTVSGTSISFGTETTLYSGAIRSSDITSGYDVNAQKHAVFFVPTSNNYALGAVATISGTSVSIGSTTTLQSSASYNAFRPNGVTYDATAQKLVVFYMDYSDSEKGKANVCTISGTTISFGTEAEWSNGTVEYIQAAYAPTLNKHVVIWRETDNSYYGMARVATVSGTSITFGTSYNFREVHSLDNAIAWDATGEKFVIATRPNTALALDVLTATVSGTDLSFSDTTRVTSNNGVYTNLEYDPDQGKVVGVFSNDGNSGYGTAFVWTTGYFSSNVTATNFAGFSNGAYTNGQTATIQIVGSVDDAQSGLTAGQKYYVQANGDLSTSPDSTSIYGGLATSSTNIIVKG